MNFRLRTGAGKTAYNPKDRFGQGGHGEPGRAEQSRENRGPGGSPPHTPKRGTETAEDARWTERLSEETLPEDFTDRFMAELGGIEIEAPEPPSAAAEPQDDKRRSSAASPRSRRTRSWIAAALAILLVGGALLYAQPTIADRVRSLFATDLLLAPDQGMKAVRAAGKVLDPQIRVEDQGFTIAVNELIADANRIVVGLTITDKNGDPFNGAVHPRFRITDGNYAEIATWSGEIIEGSTSKYNLHFTRPVLTDKMQIQAEIDQLEKWVDYKPKRQASGNWNFSIDVDLSDATAHTIQTPLPESYTTPQGVVIQMRGATRTPSGGSLEYETSLNAKAAAKAAGGTAAYHKLDYHLEDENGDMIQGSDTKDEPDKPFDLDRWTLHARWFQVLDNLDYDRQKIKFVLDSYVIREKSDAAVTFDPSALSPEQPAKFEDSGDKLVLTGARIMRNPTLPIAHKKEVKPSEMALVIGVTGTSNNFFGLNDWVAEDETGKRYEAKYSGAFGMGKDQPLDGEFVVSGLAEAPRALTLRRVMVNHTYRDADWSFVLPQTGVPAVSSQ